MSVITRTDVPVSWRVPAVGPCSCFQLRKATRAVTAFYDKYLHPAGVSITQYAILVNVARADGITRTALSHRLGMDRTTLTRNLVPLERGQLLSEAAGEDRRQKLIRLSPAGLLRVEECFPLWEQAQSAFVLAYGTENAAALASLLQQAARAVTPDPGPDAPSPSPDTPAQ
ncbi:MAG TPA: MarR family winged helix-turn-helix transcriptional regulator [Bryobacteraceae bacterium]|nr:MarR family winged helix-turn-helix transcriptional regulator [Bryobacteraceae bacterium]